MPGHLFITHGDLLHLHCDAILIPSGIDVVTKRPGHLVPPWSNLDLATDDDDCLETPPNEEHRVVRLSPGSDTGPAIWAAHSGDDRRSAKWYVKPYEEFVAAIQGQLTEPGRMLGSERLLVGVPLLGTGAGGMAHDRGRVVNSVIHGLLDLLRRETTTADVVLVLRDEMSYCAAQAARADWLRAHSPADGLSDEEADTVRRLAAEARSGRLVLFLGAGVSIGAGLPSWGDLLSGLAEMTSLDKNQFDELVKIDTRDAGTVIERELDREGLRSAIKSLVERVPLHVSLLHQLLASLPVVEALTTNYDVLFERAWEDADRRPTVVPRDIGSDRSPGTIKREWLVKLHGSVDDEDPARPLVLSRGDYLRFETSSTALAGIVQAMFLMRHLLFVGYSLSDDNLHRILHQVHETIATDAYPRGDLGNFGTVLTDQQPSLRNTMWADELTFVSTAMDDGGEPIRQIAVMLDALSAETAPRARYLGDDSFDAMLNAGEREVRNRLAHLRLAAGAPEVGEGIRAAIAEALAKFEPGTRTETSDSTSADAPK